MSAEEGSRLKLAFKQMDQDNDGKVTAGDVVRTLQTLGCKVSLV